MIFFFRIIASGEYFKEMRRFLIICMFLLLGLVSGLKAQDPGFSQFYANLLYLNPAFAGSNNCPRFSAGHRTQWPGAAIGKPFVTYGASYDQHVNFLQGGVGLQVMHDRQGNGAITASSISGIYSYSLNINRKWTVRAGFQVSYFQNALNTNDHIYPDQLDPIYGAIYSTNETDLSLGEYKNSYLDYSTGFVGYSEKYYLGVSVHHLASTVIDDANEVVDLVSPRKYTIHGGMKIGIQNSRFRRKGELSISPNLMFQQQQGFQNLTYGLYVDRKSVILGLWTRHNLPGGNLGFNFDSFIFLVGFVQEKMKFAYSYDFTVSKIGYKALGAHEISFTLYFNCKQKRKHYRAISAPYF